jgi:CRP-like cAMP-binding protein
MPKSEKTLYDPKSFLAKVGEGKVILKLRKTQIVFAQGDIANTVFYIQKGRIKVLVASEQSKEAVVGKIEPGQFFGEGCLNGHPLRISTTTAMRNAWLPPSKKRDAGRTSEGAKVLRIVHGVSAEPQQPHRRRPHRPVIQFQREAARASLLLANFGKDGTPQPIAAHVSQETLAELVSTTRSRVSFFMNKFRKLGFISHNGKIEVHNSLLNAVLYDKPEIKRDE